jgi:hypothetical protein
VAIIAGEQQSGGEVRDNDGRLIVVGPGGVGISGGGGGTASTVALDAPTLAALETISVANLLNPHPVSIATALDISDRTARLLGHVTVDNFPATQAVSGSVNVGNFPATQPVSGTVTGNQGTPNTAANGWPAKVTDGTNTAQVLNAAPGSDTGQSALAVRVVSQLGAGSGGGGSAGTIDAPADNKSPTLAQHVQAFLSCFDGTDWDRLRGDTANGLDVDVTRVQGTVATTVGNFPATQAVSGTVTANAGTGPFPVSDNGGSLTVDGSVSVSNFPATQPVSGTVNIGTAPQVAVNNVETLTDNAGFTDGTSKVFPQGYVFDETAGTALTENDIAAPRIDSKRASIQVIEDATVRGQRAAVVPAADGLANQTGQAVVDLLHTFNGDTWDRYHGNWRTTTGDTGAKTATFNGATQTNYDAVGAFICIRLGTVTGTTPAMTPQLQWSPDAGTTWINLGTTAPNLTASNQLGLIMIGPTNWSQAAGATPANLVSGANSLLALNAFLPRTWRMAFTIGGTTPSLTITAIDVNYIGGA